MNMVVGEKVCFKTGYYSQTGQSRVSDFWYSTISRGVVVKCIEGACLVEKADETRVWVCVENILYDTEVDPDGRRITND